MKYLIILPLLLFACTTNKFQPASTIDIGTRLPGTWNFKEMKNSKGKTVEFYDLGYGKTKATGPQIILNLDGSYQKKFTLEKIDSGYWKFNTQLMDIEYDLLIDSTDWIGKSVIKNKLATLKDDGNYYERITDHIIDFSESNMILNHRGYQLVYFKD